MITIKKETAEHILELYRLLDKSSMVESNSTMYYILCNQIDILNDKIEKELESVIPTFALNHILHILKCKIEEPKEYYLYDSEEIIEVLFPDVSNKNTIIQSAYNWIPCTDRLTWIVNNVLCANYYYDKIDVISNSYLISTEKLSNKIMEDK